MRRHYRRTPSIDVKTSSRSITRDLATRDSGGLFDFHPRSCKLDRVNPFRRNHGVVRNEILKCHIGFIRFPIFFFFLFLVCLFLPDTGGPCSAQSLIYQISIPFELGGTVTATTPSGFCQTLGTVLALPDKTRWPSFTATRWGEPGRVVASAVNAIHLLVSIESGQGRTVSLLPQTTIAPAAGTGAALVISCDAGRGVFGAWAPPVGSPVFIQEKNGERHPLSKEHFPKTGETLCIEVREEDPPYLIEIENRPGGRVFVWERHKGCRLIARVVRPVRGVGRFEGTLFQERGRLRANHPGVIDISTSPKGQIGGFQIIPYEHSLSPEMRSAWKQTQWLILASPDGGNTPLTGTFPLFSGVLVPGPAPGEFLWDLWSTYGRKTLILCRLNGGKLGPLPLFSGKDDQALEQITHIRIYPPTTREPLTSL